MSIVSVRLERYVLQSMARELLPNERVYHCLRSLAYGQTEVKVLYAPVSQTSHYGNLQLCASLWHCPICASKISERRRVELQPVVDKWLDERLGSVLFLTFTMRHESKEELQSVLKGLIDSSEMFRSGKWWVKFRQRYFLAGLIRALEVTHGWNGWHPHLHFLAFTTQPVDLVPFSDQIKRHWRSVLKLHGRSASYARGADIRFVDRHVPSYLLKMGLVASEEEDNLAVEAGHWTAAHELTKANIKSGRNGSRSPLDLLRARVAGDMKAGRLWQEYAEVLKGHKHLVWSQGFREYLGLGRFQSDKALVDQQDKVAVLLAQLTLAQWQQVLKQELRGQLLTAAVSGDVVLLQDFLLEYGIINVKYNFNADVEVIECQTVQ